MSYASVQQQSQSYNDWLRGWKEWARTRKRGRMAQFIVEKLEEGVSLREWDHYCRECQLMSTRASSSYCCQEDICNSKKFGMRWCVETMPPQRILVHSLCISTSCYMCVSLCSYCIPCTLYFVNILLHVTCVLLHVTGIHYIDWHVSV